MVSNLHEALVDMFRHRPSLAADLLRDVLHVELPQYDEVRLDDAEFTDVAPRQYRADSMIVLANGATPAVAVAVEVQLRPDELKRWTWPVYLTAKRARQRCRVVLLVVCVDQRTARWCRQPIEIGHPGFTLTPLVIGPEQIPLVTQPDRATPELLVLSAMAHGHESKELFPTLLEALSQIDPNRAELYCDVVLAALPLAAQQYLEELMAPETYQFQSNYAQRYFGRGKEEGMAVGEAEAILLVLDARGIAVPPHIREEITECHDLDQLRIWVRRAATVDTADALFL